MLIQYGKTTNVNTYRYENLPTAFSNNTYCLNVSVTCDDGSARPGSPIAEALKTSSLIKSITQFIIGMYEGSSKYSAVYIAIGI